MLMDLAIANGSGLNVRQSPNEYISCYFRHLAKERNNSICRSMADKLIEINTCIYGY